MNFKEKDSIILFYYKQDLWYKEGNRERCFMIHVDILR